MHRLRRLAITASPIGITPELPIGPVHLQRIDIGHQGAMLDGGQGRQRLRHLGPGPARCPHRGRVPAHGPFHRAGHPGPLHLPRRRPLRALLPGHGVDRQPAPARPGRGSLSRQRHGPTLPTPGATIAASVPPDLPPRGPFPPGFPPRFRTRRDPLGHIERRDG